MIRRVAALAVAALVASGCGLRLPPPPERSPIVPAAAAGTIAQFGEYGMTCSDPVPAGDGSRIDCAMAQPGPTDATFSASLVLQQERLTSVQVTLDRNGYEGMSWRDTVSSYLGEQAGRAPDLPAGLPEWVEENAAHGGQTVLGDGHVTLTVHPDKAVLLVAFQP